MTAPRPQSRLMTVYRNGSNCAGFILSRSNGECESFDYDQQSLGLFTDQHAAAAAILCNGELNQ